MSSRNRHPASRDIQRPGQSGGVLIAAIFVLTAVGAITASIGHLVTGRAETTAPLLSDTRAFFAAESAYHLSAAEDFYDGFEGNPEEFPTGNDTAPVWLSAPDLDVKEPDWIIDDDHFIYRGWNQDPDDADSRHMIDAHIPIDKLSLIEFSQLLNNEVECAEVDGEEICRDDPRWKIWANVMTSGFEATSDRPLRLEIEDPEDFEKQNGCPAKTCNVNGDYCFPCVQVTDDDGDPTGEEIIFRPDEVRIPEVYSTDLADAFEEEGVMFDHPVTFAPPDETGDHTQMTVLFDSHLADDVRGDIRFNRDVRFGDPTMTNGDLDVDFVIYGVMDLAPNEFDWTGVEFQGRTAFLGGLGFMDESYGAGRSPRRNNFTSGIGLGGGNTPPYGALHYASYKFYDEVYLGGGIELPEVEDDARMRGTSGDSDIPDGYYSGIHFLGDTNFSSEFDIPDFREGVSPGDLDDIPFPVNKGALETVNYYPCDQCLKEGESVKDENEPYEPDNGWCDIGDTCTDGSASGERIHPDSVELKHRYVSIGNREDQNADEWQVYEPQHLGRLGNERGGWVDDLPDHTEYDKDPDFTTWRYYRLESEG